MDKQHIIEEIRRTAEEGNGGSALGQRAFGNETGITRNMWRGKFWATWSDALAEAGFGPNSVPESHDPDELVKCLAELTRELGHYPSYGELRLAKSSKAAFPRAAAFNDHLGKHAERVVRVREFCEAHTEYSDVLDLLPEVEQHENSHADDQEPKTGYVYMFKSGKFYKIGKTFDPIRRLGEVRLQLPEGAEPVHHFETDDPSGIEKYWHERFNDKRVNGEFFTLSSADVRAFKRRKKFM